MAGWLLGDGLNDAGELVVAAGAVFGAAEDHDAGRPAGGSAGDRAELDVPFAGAELFGVDADDDLLAVVVGGVSGELSGCFAGNVGVGAAGGRGFLGGEVDCFGGH